MSDALEQFREDRALRDAAKAVLLADIDHARSAISAKGMASRTAGRIADGAKDVFEVAKVNADDNRGILAAIIGALMLWFARGSILEILGLSEPTDADEDAGAADPLDPQAELNESVSETAADKAKIQSGETEDTCEPEAELTGD